MPGIFLSCVSKEFHGSTDPSAQPWPGSYRAQLAHYLQECGQRVVYQETFAQGGGDLLAKLDDYISKECKAVVHLIGHARGWCLEDDLPTQTVTSDAVHSLLAKYGETFLAERPDLRRQLQSRNFHGLSVTQWEAYLAIHHKKPLLVFTFAETAERHPAFQLEISPPADRVTQAEHLSWLRQTNFDRTEQIQNQYHLKEKVITGLLRERIISESESQPRPRCPEFSSIGSLFMGRTEDMERLRASLRRESRRATTIVASQVIHGQGGIGKTRLAIEFGLAHAEEYSALLFVGADTPQSLETNLANLAGPLVLSLPDDAKVDAKLAAVLQWLRTHPGYFLILDNVDSEAAAQAVEEKLALLSEGHVVITSRISHWSASVEPLHLDVLSEDDSTVFLLRATARKAETGRVVTPTDDADARLLARDVAGLALALEQSSAFIRTKQTTFAKYRQRWAEFDVRVRDFKDQRLTKYPHSVHTTWATTFEQLTAGAVKLLRACSLLAHEPIPLFLLEPISSKCEDDLAELCKFSLADLGEDGTTIQVHKVVQEIVRYRMDESELRDMSDAVLKSIADVYRDRSNYELNRQRTAALSHAEAAIGYARLADNSEEFIAPYVQFNIAWHQLALGQYTLAIKNINHSIDWQQNHSERNESLIFEFRRVRAEIRVELGDLAGALDDVEASMSFESEQTPKDELRIATYRAIRAKIRRRQENWSAALDDITAAIEANVRFPNTDRQLALSLRERAEIRLQLGDRQGAKVDIMESIERARRQCHQDRRVLPRCLSDLAILRIHFAEYAGAFDAISEAIDLASQQSFNYNEELIAQWRVTRAAIRRMLGEYSSAEAEIASVLEWGLRQSPKYQHKIAEWRSVRAEIRRDVGDLVGALEDITVAIDSEMLKITVNDSGLAAFLSVRAPIRQSLGDLAGALEDFTRSINIYLKQSPNDEFRLRRIWRLRAELRYELGDNLGALEDITTLIDSKLRQIPTDESSLTLDWYMRSLIRRDLGDLKGALADINDTIDWNLRQSPVDNNNVAIGFEWRARIRYDQRDLTGALKDITTAIYSNLRQSPIDENFDASLRFDRSKYRREQGDLRGALEDITAAIDWNLRQSPVDESSVAAQRGIRAWTRRDTGDLQGAFEDITAEIDWLQGQSPINELSLAHSWVTRASIRLPQGDIARANEDITAAIDCIKRCSPVDERNLAFARYVRATIRQVEAKLSDALEDITAAIDGVLRQTPIDERSVAIFRVTLSSILQEQGTLDLALNTINQSLNWFLIQPLPDKRLIAKAHAVRAEIHRDLKNHSAARDDITPALEWYEENLPSDTRTIGIMRRIFNSIAN